MVITSRFDDHMTLFTIRDHPKILRGNSIPTWPREDHRDERWHRFYPQEPRIVFKFSEDRMSLRPVRERDKIMIALERGAKIIHNKYNTRQIVYAVRPRDGRNRREFYDANQRRVATSRPTSLLPLTWI